MTCAKSPRDPVSGLTKARQSSLRKYAKASSRSCPLGRSARCFVRRKKYSPPSVETPASSRILLAKYLSEAKLAAVALFCGYQEQRPAPKCMDRVLEETRKSRPVPPSRSSNERPSSALAKAAYTAWSG